MPAASALAWNPRSDGPELLRPCSVEGRQLTSQPGKNSRGLFFGLSNKARKAPLLFCTHSTPSPSAELRPRVLLLQTLITSVLVSSFPGFCGSPRARRASQHPNPGTARSLALPTLPIVPTLPAPNCTSVCAPAHRLRSRFPRCVCLLDHPLSSPPHCTLHPPCAHCTLHALTIEPCAIPGCRPTSQASLSASSRLPPTNGPVLRPQRLHSRRHTRTIPHPPLPSRTPSSIASNVSASHWLVRVRTSSQSLPAHSSGYPRERIPAPLLDAVTHTRTLDVAQTPAPLLVPRPADLPRPLCQPSPPRPSTAVRPPCCLSCCP